MGVTLFFVINQGKVEAIDQMERLLIDLRAAADENLSSIKDARLAERLVERVGGNNSRVRPRGVVGDDDIGATGEGAHVFGERLKGLAAHDNGVSEGDELKPL